VGRGVGGGISVSAGRELSKRGTQQDDPRKPRDLLCLKKETKCVW
jgi:hypothetical protein